MRIPPKEIKATWPAPNFVDPETRGPDLIIVELTVLPLAALVLALRLYVRIGMLHKSGWDDWLMVAAAVSFIPLLDILLRLISCLSGLWYRRYRLRHPCLDPLRLG